MAGLRRVGKLFLGYWSRLTSYYSSFSPAKQTVIQEALIWGLALLCIWWITRGLSFGKLLSIFKGSKVWMFVGANVLSFFVWWLGDTLLFATLFSFFHSRTSFRELIPATAAQYFLQAINILAADGALVIFLNRRKKVGWLTATWTMMFAGLTDALTLSGIATLAGALAPHSVMRPVLPYAAAAFTFLLLVALWWAKGNPRTGPEKWMYNRPSAHAFRAAGWREYSALISIRLAMLIIQGFLYYYSIIAFAPKVPLESVLALVPALQAASNEPITPQGLGPLQALLVSSLSQFAPRDRILAAGLAISILGILCRLPLGLGAAGAFARRVMLIEASGKHDSENDKLSAEQNGKEQVANVRR
ncbi:MAG TPA: YbhN family protein [Candidatus Binataceae bacterium]|nr:YbhN family protein [Candidatus Binataceae bacterium]